MGERRHRQDAHRRRARQEARRRHRDDGPEEGLGSGCQRRRGQDGQAYRGLPQGKRGARADQQRARHLGADGRPPAHAAPPALLPDAPVRPLHRGDQVPKHDQPREQAPDGSRRYHPGDPQRAHGEAPLPHRFRGHRRRPRPALRPHQLRSPRPGGWRGFHRPTRRVCAGHHAPDSSLAQLVRRRHHPHATRHEPRARDLRSDAPQLEQRRDHRAPRRAARQGPQG